MSWTPVVLVTLLLVACSSINVERKSKLRFDSLFFGKVESRKVLTLEPNESRSGRAFVGLLSAGPFGAVAAATTEDNFSEPMAYEYMLRIDDSESKSVVSRSVANEDDCVEVISTDESEMELLRVVSPEFCEKNHGSGINPTSG